MYHTIIKKITQKSFRLLNEHRYTDLVNGMVHNVYHNFAGDHTLGGSRNDRVAVKAWLERLGRIMPNLKVSVNHIIVKGWPNNTRVVVQWDAKATLANGEPYQNRGIHIIKVKWGKAVALDVYEDSQAVMRAMEQQFHSGISEAKAYQIIS